MQQPKISIIVPVYKVPENYLRQCIESCIGQTFRDIEIILVDDGSPDNCGAICDEYAAKDSRIKVIHKDNGGLVAARNSGFDAAMGEWHMYIDGDDWVETETCEKALESVSKYKNVDVLFWNILQDLHGTKIKGKWEWSCEDDEHLYSGDECHELARHTMIYKSGLTTAYAKLINTKWAKANGICHDCRLRQGEEGVEFTLRMFYYARKALFVRQYWNIYRYTEGSISKQVNEKNTEYITDCFRVMEEDIEKFENRDAVRQMFYQRVVYALIAIAMSTYFHPSNTDSLVMKIRKYTKVINDTPLYRESIRKTPLKHMDKLRIITLYCIKMRFYIALHFISMAKQYMLKKGKFNY